MNLTVTSARHKAVVEHAGRRRLVRVALPALAATLVTGSVVGLSLAGDVAAPEPSAMAGANIGAARSGTVITADRRERMEDREQSISRSARRVTIEDEPKPKGHKFSTADLNIRKTPAENADVVTTVDPATKLSVTGEVDDGYAEVIWKDEAYWVSADYLAREKPEEERRGRPRVAESRSAGSAPLRAPTAPPSRAASPPARSPCCARSAPSSR